MSKRSRTFLPGRIGTTAVRFFFLLEINLSIPLYIYLIIKAIRFFWSVRRSFYSFVLPPNLYLYLYQIINEGTFLTPKIWYVFVRPLFLPNFCSAYRFVRRTTFSSSIVSPGRTSLVCVRSPHLHRVRRRNESRSAFGPAEHAAPRQTRRPLF